MGAYSVKEWEDGMQSLKWSVALVVFLAAQPALAQDDAKATAGAEVYATNCSPCHGDKLANAGGMPDLKQLGPGDYDKFKSVVTDGKGQMPSWEGQLSDAEIEQIWAYIRSKASN